MSKRVKILSIDGGGIRGIIPAMILAEIEKRTRKPIADLFDLIAGTSTGGILALGLTVPNRRQRPQYSAQRLVRLYETEGKRIFHRPVLHTIHSVGGMLQEKYPADGIEKVLASYFKKVRLKHALKEVLITSYDIERRKPYFFKRRKAKKSSRHDFLMGRVARATAAAPTYFEPAKLTQGQGRGYRALIDGGVFANNPALCALVEAAANSPKETDFLVISLGTGVHTRKLPYKKAVDWGLVKWAPSLLSVVFDGVSDAVDYQLKQLLPPNQKGVPRYYRFQAELKHANDDLDDASRGNIQALKKLARKILREQKGSLKTLSRQLIQ